MRVLLMTAYEVSAFIETNKHPELIRLRMADVIEGAGIKLGDIALTRAKDRAPTNGDDNPARQGDCAKPCGAPGCASWGCLS